MLVPDYDQGPTKPAAAAAGAPQLSPLQQFAVPLIAIAAIVGAGAGYALNGGGGGGDSVTPPVALASDAAACAAVNSWGKPQITDQQRNQQTMASFSPRVRALLAGMTTEQKVGQMVQLNIDEAFSDGGTNGGFKGTAQFADAPWDMLDESLIRSYTGAPNYIGSWLNSPFSDDIVRIGTDGTRRSSLNATEWRLIIKQIQTITIEDGSPPLVFGLDSVRSPPLWTNLQT